MSEPLDRPAECDIIMKGGITSGVVYPLAVCELARTYRFRNIGGTSAGAIAAALTAAAELGRGKPDAGFEWLEKLPEFLGKNLLSLFQPSPETRPAFAVLLAFLGNHSKTRKTLRALYEVLRHHWFVALLGMALGAVVWGLFVWLPLWLAGERFGPGLLPGMGITAAVFAVIAALVFFGRSAWKALNENGFGLCNGKDQTQKEQPLTPWLAEELNRTAGKDWKDGPLTFGDLWGEGDRKAQENDPTLRRINLEVMTTSLTHGWPRRIPFSTKDLYFDPRELKKYFPKDIVQWMLDHQREPSKPGSMTDRIVKERMLYPLPLGADLPVVVGARMSLSFPGLISAIPLYAVNWSLEANSDWRTSEAGEPQETKIARKAPQNAPVLGRCWFSDGGIGSNFPVHFFDSLLPRRPTFGINLRSFSEVDPQHLDDESENIDFPKRAGDGVRPLWTCIEDVKDFAGAILDTMQNWVDNTQMRLPGYRDRVVHVLLSEKEGGVNLTMPAELIGKLTERGRAAGQALSGFDWNGHRWIRYLSAMSQLQLRLGSLDKVYQEEFREFLAFYDCSGKPYARSNVWKEDALQKTDLMVRMMEAWEESTHPFMKDAPRPEPELRIGPKR